MRPAWLAAVPASDCWRARPAGDVLDEIWPQAERAGITRLAELTWLDEIGLPVFQAVRPASRALSVHQGKGATDTDARLSAVMEAVESAAAEAVIPDGPAAPFDALPPGERAADLRDYGKWHPGAAASPAARIQWHSGERLDTARRFWLPFDTVTLDLSRPRDSGIVRSSAGLAAGATAADALLSAAFELVEREAQARWLAGGLVGQSLSTVDLASIDADWFKALCTHLDTLELRLSVYAMSGLGGLPVVVCRIDEPGFAPSFAGAACRRDPMDALLRAFGEAAQSRLTVISGTRDDIDPAEPSRSGRAAIGPPTSHPRAEWRRFADAAVPCCPVTALIEAGFAPVRVDYPSPAEGAAVVKIVALGLPTDAEMLQ